MMEYQNLLVEQVNQGISRIILNRPEKQNALSLELMKEFCQVLSFLERSSCRVVILSSQGKNFCSGMDLNQAADEALIETMGTQLAQMFTALHETPLVTIAAVQGHALAGGGGLAASCDMMLLAEGSKIGFPEVRRGIVAAQVSVILLEQISLRHVRELLLTAQLIDCERALEIGLANRVVKEENLMEAALQIAEEVIKGAPNAIKETKRLLKKLAAGDFTQNLEQALAVHHAARHSVEGKEGIASFLEKNRKSK